MGYTYNFPSGMVATLRGWTFNDLPESGGDDSVETTRLLAKCTVSIDQVGPYEHDASRPFDWGQVIQAERILALCAARVAMGVPELSIDHRCSRMVVKEVDGKEMLVKCGARMAPANAGVTPLAAPPTIDLRELIEYGVSDLPASTVDAIRDGNRFERVVRGVRVAFKLLTGNDLVKINRFAAQVNAQCEKERVAAIKAYQFLEIDAVSGPQMLYKHLLSMPGDMLGILDVPSRFEPLVDTEFDLTCRSCRVEERVEIPLPSGDFWRPEVSDSEVDVPVQVRRARTAEPSAAS